MEQQNGPLPEYLVKSGQAPPRADAAAVAAANEAVSAELDKEIEAAGGPWEVPEDERDAVGRTAFDLPTSKDGTITVLLPKESIGKVPSQALVRIESKEDHKSYLAVVVEGPFAEPDGLRADAPVMVATTVRGRFLMPRYHGRVHVELMGERLDDGTLVPPRYRPVPNSAVFTLGPDETAEALRLKGDLRLGRVVGQEEVAVRVDAASKEVLPRHTAVLGTTGGGKSTTIAGLVAKLQAAGCATVVFDTEGEYTALDQATDDPKMAAALGRVGLAPAAIRGTRVFHLVNRETRNPKHGHVHAFSLRFEDLAPEAVMEILELNEPQRDRFVWAYDAAKRYVDPALTREERDRLLELDELEQGYPRVTLDVLYEVVAACAGKAGKDTVPEHLERALTHDNFPGNKSSWLVLQGKLGRIRRLRVFDQPGAPLDDAQFVRPGYVSVVDLSDTDSPTINNLVIADLLRTVQRVQEARYDAARREGKAPAPTVVIVEEAHEFLSAGRIKQMPVLFEQVARIARRGRKRWLGLVFVTQLPQHLPDEVFGLVNNYVLHKIADPGVVDRLRKTVGQIDRSLWDRLPTLAPGQAIVSFGGMARPLLTAIDPAGAKLLMAE